MRQNLTLVVGRSPRKNLVSFDDRFEWRSLPKFQWIGRLNVVVPVNQDRPSSWSLLIAGNHHRIPSGLILLRLKSRSLQTAHQPIRAGIDTAFKLAVSRNRRKSQEFEEIVKRIH